MHILLGLIALGLIIWAFNIDFKRFIRGVAYLALAGFIAAASFSGYVIYQHDALKTKIAQAKGLPLEEGMLFRAEDKAPWEIDWDRWLDHSKRLEVVDNPRFEKCKMKAATSEGFNMTIMWECAGFKD